MGLSIWRCPDCKLTVDDARQHPSCPHEALPVPSHFCQCLKAIEPDPRSGPFNAEYLTLRTNNVDLANELNKKAEMGWRLAQIYKYGGQIFAVMERLSR